MSIRKRIYHWIRYARQGTGGKLIIWPQCLLKAIKGHSKNAELKRPNQQRLRERFKDSSL